MLPDLGKLPHFGKILIMAGKRNCWGKFCNKFGEDFWEILFSQFGNTGVAVAHTTVVPSLLEVLDNALKIIKTLFQDDVDKFKFFKGYLNL